MAKDPIESNGSPHIHEPTLYQENRVIGIAKQQRIPLEGGLRRLGLIGKPGKKKWKSHSTVRVEIMNSEPDATIVNV